MGVVYKLTPEVSSFIIEQKRNDPKITCQNLAGTVFLRFGQRVSKSSVHELLKQSHVITPRARKTKEKFQIPLEKKAEISKALAKVVPELLVPNAPAVLPQTPAAPKEMKTEPQREAVVEERRQELSHAGEIFLESALYDLSFKPILGIKQFSDVDSLPEEKIKLEWDYFNQEIQGIKIQTQSGEFYIDPRFQGIYAQTPQGLGAPIERASFETADYILNSIQPLILRGSPLIDLSLLKDFFASFENRESHQIKALTLIGPKQRAYVEFNDPMPYKRGFIVGFDSELPEIKELTKESDQETEWEFVPGQFLRVLSKNGRKIISNLKSSSYDDLWELFENRHGQDPLLLSPFSHSSPPTLGLKERLKQRAKTFFPLECSSSHLETFLNLPGYEITSPATPIRRVYISMLSEDEKELLQTAAANVNSLDIKDFNGKNIRIFIG